MLIQSLLIAPAFLICAWAQSVTAVPPAIRSYSFPPVGLASSEIAQINILNTATATVTPVTTSAAPACTGTITFFNASGATAGSAVAFTTTGSQIYSTQLAFSKLATSGTRAEFVASVAIDLTSNGQASCTPVISLETFDSSTGATHVYQSGSVAATAVPILLNGKLAVQ